LIAPDALKGKKKKRKVKFLFRNICVIQKSFNSMQKDGYCRDKSIFFSHIGGDLNSTITSLQS